MKTLKYLPLSLFILSSCISLTRGPASEDTHEVLRGEDCEEADVIAKRLRNNKEIYWGDGTAPIKGNDPGAAKDIAEKRAIRDLSEAIRVEVQADFEIIVIGTDDVITEEITDRIRTYTQAVLSEREESEPFYHCPFEGQVTYYTWVMKKDYNEMVKRDLQRKTSIIKSTILAGNSEFASRNYITAVQSWIRAKGYLRGFFGNIPVRGELEEGNMEEMNDYLDRRINNFFRKIHLEILNDDFVYDAQGNITKTPKVYASYIDGDKRDPLTSLSLLAMFVTGAGEISDVIATDTPSGIAEVRIDRVDPSTRAARIKVEVDKDAFEGLEIFRLGSFASVPIYLTKKRTIGVLVAIEGIKQSDIVQNAQNDITSLLNQRGIGIAKIKLDNGDVDQQIMSRAVDVHADYLIRLLIKVVQPPYTVGDLRIFKTILSGYLSVYEVPGGEWTQKTIPDKEGFGASADLALWDAYGKLRQPIAETVKNLIAELK